MNANVSRFLAVASLAVAVALPLALARPALAATDVQIVKGPLSGVTAWLVEDYTVPVVAMDFGFRGAGSAEDPEGKEGVTYFLSGMLDEGAGDLDSAAFQKRLDELNVSVSFDQGRDSFTGAVTTQRETMDDAFGLLKVALTAPRFDAEPLERVRRQILVGLEAERNDPDTIASRVMTEAVLPGHPYARPSKGTPATVAAIGADDLRAHMAARLTRDTLMIGVSGAISAAELAAVLDSTFGALPETAAPQTVATATLTTDGQTLVRRLPVPQSEVRMVMAGLTRDDPDFIPGYVMNYILGGGGFSSRLMVEVREKRGLAYGVWSYLYPLDHAAMFMAGTATQNSRVAESVSVMKAEFARLAAEGVTAEELADAKTYLTGAYPLRFDTNGKIAGQLLSLQMDDLGIDYLTTRNQMIEAVTLDDIRRVAARVLKPETMVTVVVGQPEGLEGATEVKIETQ